MARKRGFWDKAIYVGLAIILVLVLVGMRMVYGPHGASRAERYHTQCMSNEHILAMALLAYAADKDDCLPPARAWAGAVLPYVWHNDRSGPKSFYDCPAERHPVKVPGIDWGDARGLSYAMSLGLPFVKLSDCQSPARTIVLFDSDRVPVAWPGRAAARHQHGAICAFADGHVKWMPRSQIRNMPGGK